MINVHSFYLIFAVISGSILLLGLFNELLKKSIITEIMLATLIGIAVGINGMNLVTFEDLGLQAQIMDIICSFCLGMGLMASALRIPTHFIISEYKLVSKLLFILMPLMFIMSTTIILLVFHFDLTLCLLIGAIITATDPVISSTIISGKMSKEVIDSTTRYAISFESGANDGLAFPFVAFSLVLLQNTNYPLEHWVLKSFLWQTLSGVLLGLVAGYVLGKLFNIAIRKGFTSTTAILSFTISLSVIIMSGFELLEINGILAVFISGVMFAKVFDNRTDINIDSVQSMMERLFTIPVFIFFGMIAPVQSWIAFGWKGLILVLLILICRRPMILLMINKFFPELKLKDLLFVGWFGPIGVAAIYYAFYSFRKVNIPEIWPVTSLIVFASVFIHGITSLPFLNLYKKFKKVK